MFLFFFGVGLLPASQPASQPARQPASQAANQPANKSSIVSIEKKSKGKKRMPCAAEQTHRKTRRRSAYHSREWYALRRRVLRCVCSAAQGIRFFPLLFFSIETMLDLLAGWLAAWLAGWRAGWLAGWLAGSNPTPKKNKNIESHS